MRTTLGDSRLRSLAIVLGTAALAASAWTRPAWAQPPTSWRDYRFIAFDRMDLGAGAALRGSYVVLNQGGSLFVRNGAKQFDALPGEPTPVVVADAVTLSNNTSVVDLYRNALAAQSSAVIRGIDQNPHPFPVVLPDLPLLPGEVYDPCTLTKPKTVVPAGGTLNLVPGCYGEFEAKERSSVRLAPGVYNFLRWNVRDQVAIQVTGPGATTIYVRRNVRTQNDTTIEPASGWPDDLTFFTGGDLGTSSSLGPFNLFIGSFLAPNDSELVLRRKIEFVGTAVAPRIKLRDSCDEVELPFCGDGILQPGEACDPPGILVPPVFGGPVDRICEDTCTFCGDSVVQSPETCDDGNDVDEPNGDPLQCRNDCTFCGDGVQQIQYGELCEPPGSITPDGLECSASCLPKSVPRTCREGGPPNPALGETCSAGSSVPPVQGGPANRTCRGDCTYCGDGIVQAGEACDDGNSIDDDQCNNQCTKPRKGVPGLGPIGLLLTALLLLGLGTGASLRPFGERG